MIGNIIENDLVNVITTRATVGKTTMLAKIVYENGIINGKKCLVLTNESKDLFIDKLKKLTLNENIPNNIIFNEVGNFTTLNDIENIIGDEEFDFVLIDDAYHSINMCTKNVLLLIKELVKCNLIITTSCYASIKNGLDIPLISKLDDNVGFNIIHLENVHFTRDGDKVLLVRQNGKIIGSTVINFKELTFK